VPPFNVDNCDTCHENSRELQRDDNRKIKTLRFPRRIIATQKGYQARVRELLNKADLKVMREGLENGNPVLCFGEVAHAEKKTWKMK
jgi:hypothetical protein